MRNSLDNLRWQWEHRTGVTPRWLGVAAHAALVHIHPFVDGNGRVTRLTADLIYIAAQDDEPLMGYDWEAYMRLLGEYDMTRDPTALAEFVNVTELD